MLTEECESALFALKAFESVIILTWPFENAGRVVAKNTYERMCSSVDDFRHDGEFVLLSDGNWNLVHGAALVKATSKNMESCVSVVGLKT
jgi:surface antigen